MTHRSNSKTTRNASSKFRKRADVRRSAEQKRRLLMETMEDRRMLAVTIDPSIFEPQLPRNVGTVAAYQFNEQELANSPGGNDTFNTAEFVPLGTLPGQQNTIDLNGQMSSTRNAQGRFITDVDTYAVDLRAGDILDLALTGAVGNMSVYYGEGTSRPGQFYFGADDNQAIDVYGNGSPLQDVGSSVAAQVIPEDGRYYIALAPTFNTSVYSMGMRVYRPIMEQTPVGTKQILYVDFDGGYYSTDLISGSTLPRGLVRFPSLQENLDVLGFTNPNAVDIIELQEEIMEEVRRAFGTLATFGTNGDYDSTGVGGDFGIEIIGSNEVPELISLRDPDSQYYDLNLSSNPLLTRMLVGAEEADVGLTGGLLGIAQSVDVGNFDTSEIGLVLMDAVPGAATIPLSPSASQSSAMARLIANTIVHEAAHTFGERHTDGTNTFYNIIDGPGPLVIEQGDLGVGFDGVYGTADDTNPIFPDTDAFDLNEGLLGYSRTGPSLSHSLSTGTIGTPISGTAWNDANQDGRFAGEVGLEGVTIFADVDGDGVQDPSEPSDVTDVNGNYSLLVAAGMQWNIVAVPDVQYASTSTNPVAAAGGATDVNFGFYKLIPDADGVVFADFNGNGNPDNTEPGLQGITVYLDQNDNDILDAGDVTAVSDANGRYRIEFPGAGTYTLRADVPAGFQQTSPVGSEYSVDFDGLALTQNFFFGLLPSRDYGDAPDTYGTFSTSGGPSHGLSSNIGLGLLVDRETNGAPSSTALGDDNNGIDDEDGISLTAPFGPGGTGAIDVYIRNTSGEPAYLQGWVDFDASGTFDNDEQVFTNVPLSNGVNNLPVVVPEDAVVGSTFTRFRYSPTRNLGPNGEADLGEVEDHQIDILEEASITNADSVTVTRNSVANQIFVLANDFESSSVQLEVDRTDATDTAGTVQISQDSRSVIYTPPNGFVGRDSFGYRVQDQNGNIYPALNEPATRVEVNVTFQSNKPIAVDDIFEFPSTVSNQPLNVLDNDIFSLVGGTQIVSVTAGDQGGQVTIEGGQQTIRYTPQPSFSGTEQFFYTISDANGEFSTAQVTINTLPGANLDDRVEFDLQVLDFPNRQPIPGSIEVGEEFYLQVTVDDLDNPANAFDGLASAFLDVLYTDFLVSPVTDGAGNIDVEFGELFSSTGATNLTTGSAEIPGLLEYFGAVQPPGNANQNNSSHPLFVTHSGPTVLFTIKMKADSSGIASFKGDPTDVNNFETVLIGEENSPTTVPQMRFGSTELEIFPPANGVFPAAIDDSFPEALDSEGRLIVPGSEQPFILDVLANDQFGETGQLTDISVNFSNTLGEIDVVDINGTPGDLTDDVLAFTPADNVSGFASFTYTITTLDGVVSRAEVTLNVGTNSFNDDEVDLTMALVDADGNPILNNEVTTGDRFGVQFYAEDIRGITSSFVFAAFQDMMFDSDLITVADTAEGRDPLLGFDVTFGPLWDGTVASGSARRPGIVDEFGTALKLNIANEYLQGTRPVDEPSLVATIFFDATGSALFDQPTQIISGPVESLPFHDTLLGGFNNSVERSHIRYDVLDITLKPANSLQNSILPEDVNGDGRVTPLDAINVITSLGANPEGESTPGKKHLFTDVNGDFRTTPLDAIKVINYLSQNFGINTGEGEGLGGAAQQADLALVADDDDDDLINVLAADQFGLA